MTLPLRGTNSKAILLLKTLTLQNKPIMALGPSPFMSSLNKVSQTAFLEKKGWKLEAYRFLFLYQNCLHTTTKILPYKLMFNQKEKITFSHNASKINIDNINSELEHHTKEYHDKRHYTKDISLQVGDRVMVKQRKLNKPYSSLHLTY